MSGLHRCTNDLTHDASSVDSQTTTVLTLGVAVLGFCGGLGFGGYAAFSIIAHADFGWLVPAAVCFALSAVGEKLHDVMINWSQAYIANLKTVCKLLHIDIRHKPGIPWFETTVFFADNVRRFLESAIVNSLAKLGIAKADDLKSRLLEDEFKRTFGGLTMERCENHAEVAQFLMQVRRCLFVCLTVPMQVVRLHRLREIIKADYVVGVLGTMKTGKSTLLYRYGLDSKPDELRHTLDITPHYFTDVDCFHFLDFPGSDDVNEATAAAFSNLYNSCDAFIFVLELDKKDAAIIIKMIRTVATLNRPVLVCLNKADHVACQVKVCNALARWCEQMLDAESCEITGRCPG